MKTTSKLVLGLLLYILAPLFISFWSDTITTSFFSVGILLPIKTLEYTHVSNLCVDLLMRSLYFSILIVATRNCLAAIPLFVLQTLTMWMFLRYGAMTLYAAVVGSIEFFGL
jgi:hypothetical protein